MYCIKGSRVCCFKGRQRQSAAVAATATATLLLLLPPLQGGPGCSSLFGTFYLNGPFALQTDLTLQPNPGRWNRQYGMLFVDQPIGTGFSVAGGSVCSMSLAGVTGACACERRHGWGLFTSWPQSHVPSRNTE